MANNSLENAATVKDLADWFNKLVSEGKGDYVVDVDDNCGGSYPLFKDTRYGTVFENSNSVSIGDFNIYFV